MSADRVTALLELLDLDPDDGFALYALALERKAVGKLPAAEGLLRRLLDLEPDHLYGYYQLGEVLLADDRPQEAAEILDAGLARAAAEPKARAELQALRDTCD